MTSFREKMALRFLPRNLKQYTFIKSLVGHNGSHVRNLSREEQETVELSEETESDTESEAVERHQGIWSSCLNEVKLIGNFSRDPVEKIIPDKYSIVFVPLVTKIFFRTSSGEIGKYITWHKLMFKELNLKNFVLNYLKKGSRVYVSGNLINQRFSIEEEKPELVHTFVHCTKLITLKRQRTSESS